MISLISSTDVAFLNLANASDFALSAFSVFVFVLDTSLTASSIKSLIALSRGSPSVFPHLLHVFEFSNVASIQVWFTILVSLHKLQISSQSLSYAWAHSFGPLMISSNLSLNSSKYVFTSSVVFAFDTFVLYENINNFISPFVSSSFDLIYVKASSIAFSISVIYFVISAIVVSNTSSTSDVEPKESISALAISSLMNSSWLSVYQTLIWLFNSSFAFSFAFSSCSCNASTSLIKFSTILLISAIFAFLSANDAVL